MTNGRVVRLAALVAVITSLLFDSNARINVASVVATIVLLSVVGVHLAPTRNLPVGSFANGSVPQAAISRQRNGAKVRVNIVTDDDAALGFTPEPLAGP